MNIALPLSRHFKKECRSQPTRFGLVSAADSICGGRAENEDRVYRCDECQFYMVVDGIGGHPGGKLASLITIDSIAEKFVCQSQDCDSESDLESVFQNSLCNACFEMTCVADQNEEYAKMGCTLAAALIRDGHLYFANIGDCRVYLFQNNSLSLLSHDETVAQQLFDNGLISRNQCRVHQWKHLVTNSVSARGMKHLPEIRSVPISADSRVLITSDGLTNELDDQEIEKIIQEARDPDDCVAGLINTAQDRSACDNVSCIVVNRAMDAS